MVLEEGIVDGRKIFANIQKDLKMTASVPPRIPWTVS